MFRIPEQTFSLKKNMNRNASHRWRCCHWPNSANIFFVGARVMATGRVKCGSMLPQVTSNNPAEFLDLNSHWPFSALIGYGIR